MRSQTAPFLLFCAFGLLALDGCEKADSDSDSTEELLWYSTCGDPVCVGYSGPFDGVDLCVSEVEGEVCETAGAECDFESECNALLVCATEDPKDQPGGCPISRKRFKREIHYLDDSERATAAQALMQMRLATWQYQWEDEKQPNHLGFIIDDSPETPAVRADGERVDLYGYTSMAVAAIQAQQAEIDALRVELELLREQRTCPK
jgi:hypothetical protein